MIDGIYALCQSVYNMTNEKNDDIILTTFIV